MRIAIVGPSPVPFGRGGIENFMAGLHRAINDLTPHSAELIKIPIKENTAWKIAKAYYTFYRTRLDHFDLVISVKYPAWNIRHRNHVIYLGHRLRGLYDTYPIPPEKDKLTKARPLDFPGPWIKRLVHWLDNRAIRPETIAHAFCTSKTIASRNSYFHPDLPPTVVYHSTAHENYRRKPGRYLFTVNRLDAPKRVDLMIQAYMMTQTSVPFLIAGTGPHEPYLRSLADNDSRIQFLGDVSEEKLIDLYAESLAVLYTPYQEDYGLITVEAMKSGKPVITTSDSGGPLEFVVHDVTGWISDPDPADLARTITEALKDTEKIETMGDAAEKTVAHISWRNTVKNILAPYAFWPEPGPKKRNERRRVTILTPYPIYPPRSGGQKRVVGLAEQLATVYDVFLLSLGRFNTPYESLEITPWLHEIRIPMSPAHAREQWEFEKEIGEAISDAALDLLLQKTPNYIRALRHFEACSDIIISEQPYMHRFIQRSPRTRLIVHSSQNVETRLKEDLDFGTRKSKFLFDRVQAVEAAAVTQSDLVFATSLLECADFFDLYGRQVHHLPNGIDTSTIRPAEQSDRERARALLKIDPTLTVCLFVAAWHPPNLDAFYFLLNDVVPHLPEALFLVVGSIRDHFVAHGGDIDALPPNIRLTGEVDEEVKNAALAAADIALNPMYFGAGTNMKILEYAAAGIPIVTTQYGIRGLEFEPGKSVFAFVPERVFGPELAGYVEMVKKAIADPDARVIIAAEARRVVVERYDWKSIGPDMIDAIESALPVVGSGHIDMHSSDPFLAGWHYAEKWEDTGSGPGFVRWTTGRGNVRIPSPRQKTKLRIGLQGGFDQQKLTVFLDAEKVIECSLTTPWQTIEILVEPVPGCDERRLVIESDTWSPSDKGSPDRRILGVAVAEIDLRL